MGKSGRGRRKILESPEMCMNLPFGAVSASLKKNGEWLMYSALHKIQKSNMELVKVI